VNNDRILSLFGLAKKAGKLKSGEYCVEEEIKKGRAKLVVCAKDASENTRKKYSDMCNFRHVPIYYYSNKEDLAKCIGAQLRSAVVIIDEGFANSIIRGLNNNENV